VGALLLTTAGFAVTFAVAATGTLAFAVVLALIPIRQEDRSRSHDRSMRAGWRYVRRNTSIMALLIGVAALGMGVDPVITLTPALAARLGEGTELVGLLASAFGVGAITGFLTLSLAQRLLSLHRTAVIGLLCIAAGMLALT